MAKRERGDKVTRAMTALGLQARERRTARFDIRVTETERAEVTETAGKLGLTVTDYLMQLHRHARQHLK